MAKKTYAKPEIVKHEPIVFETGLSNCTPICYGLYACPDPDNPGGPPVITSP